jgi:hypothetical protein
VKDKELLADLVQHLAQQVREEVENLSAEELAWQPDSEANSIGVTVWHFSRWLDLLGVRAFENRPAEEEQWYTRGWAEQTGYRPLGIGYAGLGAITGYTQEEVKAIPPLPASGLLAYLEQVSEALRQKILALPDGGLEQTAPGLGGKRTYYQFVKPILMGSFGHVGEIAALKAMHARTRTATI